MGMRLYERIQKMRTVVSFITSPRVLLLSLGMQAVATDCGLCLGDLSVCAEGCVSGCWWSLRVRGRRSWAPSSLSPGSEHPGCARRLLGRNE